MRAAWQNRNLRRMGKYEPSPLKMLIRAFLRGNDLKAFLFPQSAFFAFPRLCHLKPTTATTTWNSKQMLDFAIFCLFRRSFQKKVWHALLEIPYGETRSYKEIAISIGKPKGIRAVASAIGANGISIFVPCHRVIGSNHSLTGFAGGLDAKRKLLELEAE